MTRLISNTAKTHKLIMIVLFFLFFEAVDIRMVTLVLMHMLLYLFNHKNYGFSKVSNAERISIFGV